MEDYIARIEETCGEEKSAIVTFKYEKKDEALARISKKAKLRNSISGIILEYSFQDVSFRVFTSGKAIFKGFKDKNALRELLSALLLQ